MTIIGAQPCQFNEGNTDLVALVNGTCSECRQLGLRRRLLQALMLSPAASLADFAPEFSDGS